MAQDEMATVRALGHAREVFREAVREAAGRVVDTAGDSVLAVFDSATHALEAAIRVQRQLALAARADPARALLFRVGLHLGDVILHPDGTVYGDGVNIAARVQALAEPGGIETSDSFRHACQGAGVRFVDRGEHVVKNVPRPVRTYRVLADAAQPARGWKVMSDWLRRKSARTAVVLALILGAGLATGLAFLAQWNAQPSTPERRLAFAILPLEVESGDAATVSLARRMSESLVEYMASLPWGTVAPLDSAAAAARRDPTPRALGDALRVDFVVRGRASRANGRLAMSFVVIDTRNDVVLGRNELSWPLDKPVSGTSAELDRAVAFWFDKGFDVELRNVQRKRADRLDAKDLVFLAIHAWQRDEKSYGPTMDYVQRALQLEPDNLLALRFTALVNLCECVRHWSRDPARQQEIGARALDRALVLSPESAGLLNLKVQLLVDRGEYADALEMQQRLVRQSPEDGDLLATKAYLLLKLGRAHDALPVIRQALAASPFETNVARTRRIAACILFARAADAEASELARNAQLDYPDARLADPMIGGIVLVRAAAQARLGHADAATQALAAFRRSAPAVTSLRALRAWEDPRWELAGYEPLHDALRLAGLPD
jgi:adenylate cyclase